MKQDFGKLMGENLLQQISNISKASAYDIVSKQVGELQGENAKLREALELIITSPEWIKNYGGGAVDKKAKEALKTTKFS